MFRRKYDLIKESATKRFRALDALARSCLAVLARIRRIGYEEKSKQRPRLRRKAEEKRHKKEKKKFSRKGAELKRQLEDEFVPVLGRSSRDHYGGVGFDLIPDELQNVLEILVLSGRRAAVYDCFEAKNSLSSGNRRIFDKERSTNAQLNWKTGIFLSTN